MRCSSLPPLGGPQSSPMGTSSCPWMEPCAGRLRRKASPSCRESSIAGREEPPRPSSRPESDSLSHALQTGFHALRNDPHGSEGGLWCADGHPCDSRRCMHSNASLSGTTRCSVDFYAPRDRERHFWP